MNLAFSYFAFQKFPIWRTCQSINCNCVPGAWVQPEAAPGELLISNFLLRKTFLQYISMSIYFSILQYNPIYLSFHLLIPRQLETPAAPTCWSPSFSFQRPAPRLSAFSSSEPSSWWYILSTLIFSLAVPLGSWFSSWFKTHFETLNHSTSVLTRMFCENKIGANSTINIHCPNDRL